MSFNFTPRQIEVLTLIRRSIEELGFAPTLQEMADELGIDKSAVFEHADALVKKGALLRKPRLARSLTITPDVVLPDEKGDRCPGCGAVLY